MQRQQAHDASRPVLQQINNEPTEALPEIPVPPPFPAQLPAQPLTPVASRIQSLVYKRAAATSSACLFLGCHQSERLLEPKALREMLLIHKMFYVPTCARICRYHLDNGHWSDLTSNLQDFTGAQFDAILKILGRAALYCLEFENISAMAPHLCHYWLGMNADQFNELLACVQSLSQFVKNPSVTLCIYIVKLRTGDSN